MAGQRMGERISGWIRFAVQYRCERASEGRMPLDPRVPNSDITHDIIGAAMRVHSRLGPGLKEIHYHRALVEEIQKGGRKATEEYFVEFWDGEAWLGRLYLDVLVDDVIDAEIKAHPYQLTDE